MNNVKSIPTCSALTERDLTMQSMRCLCRTAEALAQALFHGVPPEHHRSSLRAIWVCTDRAEHIAGYVESNVELATRMMHIAKDMAWLAETLPTLDQALRYGPPYNYDIGDILKIGRQAWELSARPLAEWDSLLSAHGLTAELLDV